MSAKRKLAEVARVHQMAQRVIADKIRGWLAIQLVERADKVAGAIIAELAAHDPPLFICTADEMRE